MENFDFVSRIVGRTLTEYKHPNYEALVKNFSLFYVISQFDDKALVEPIKGKGWFKSSPNISAGEILFGVKPDGYIVRLKELIDSSG